MSRPSVLIVEPDTQRRHDLGHGMASEGYEVVPASSVEEGARFAQGLGPAVIIAPAHLAQFGDASILAELTRYKGGMKRTLVLLGDTPDEEKDLPSEVVFLATRDLAPEALMRRLRLVLIGREIDVEADARLETLVGDLAHKPLLELVRSLNRALITGRLELAHGRIDLEHGEVVRAQAHRVDGLKAFCRLARLTEAPFRIQLLQPSELQTQEDRRRIRESFDALLSVAIQDSLGQFPDPLARLRAVDDKDLGHLEPLEQKILQAARQGVAVQEVLDSLEGTDGEIANAILILEERGLLRRQEVVAKVRIVTDSTADLPPELARAHGISVVPLQVRFGRKTYLDRVDLQPRDFYRILEQKIADPETEAPEVESLTKVYQRLGERSDVIALHISAELSETCERAGHAMHQVAQNLIDDRQLQVVDSRHISMALGLQALFASRMAARGLDTQQIMQRLEAIRPRIQSLSVLDTLDYLVNNNRLGKMRAVFGGLLNIKPILCVDNGDISIVDRARGLRAALPKLLELLDSSQDSESPSIVAITHANAPAWADRLRKGVEEQHTVEEMILTEAGPAIGANVGPGTFGIAMFQPDAEELPLVSSLDSH